MRLLTTFCFVLVAAAAMSPPARAQDAVAKKEPEIRTVLATSAPLSPAQLAKQAMPHPSEPAAAAPVPAGKAPAFSTSRPPDPKRAGLEAAAGAAKLDRIARTASLPGPAATMHAPKPAAFGTAKALDPAVARAKESVAALKDAHAHGAPAARATAKPQSVTTTGPAPATSSAAQQAKHSASSANGRKPS